MSEPSTTARPRRSPLLVVWRLCLRTAAVCVIGLALLVGLFRLALPFAPNYHAQIEAWAGRALDVRVILSEVDARWPLLSGPELVFEDAALWSPDGDALLLSAERGSVALDLMALMTGFAVKPGKVVLRGVVIDVEHRSEEGGWQVLGRAVAPNRAPDAALSKTPARPRGAQALPRGRLEIEDATIIVTDDRNGPEAGPSRIAGVHLDFAHERGTLDLEGSLEAPGDGGEISFSVEGRDLTESSREGRWQFFLAGANVDFGALGAVVGLAPTALHGIGNVTLWASRNRGRIEQASLTLDLDDLLLAGERHAVQYDRLAGRFNLSAHSEDGWALMGRDLELAREGHSWPTSSFSVELDGKGVRAARADYLRVDDLLPLANVVLSLDRADRPTVAKQVLALEPLGELSSLSFERDAAQGPSLAARFEAVAIKGTDELPGVTGLSGAIDLQGKSGTLELKASELVFAMPGVFRQPLPPMQVGGAVDWSVNAEGRYEVHAQELVLDGPAFRAEGQGQLTLPSANAGECEGPYLDLELALADTKLAMLRRYVPALVMRPKVASWLEKALVSGSAPRANFAFKGPLRAFPFDNGEGEFIARAQLQDVELDYADGFPHATGITGVVALDNVRLDGEGFAGETVGNAVRTLEVHIADVREGVLEYRSRTRGTLASVIAFLRGSPWKHHVAPLEQVSGRGEVALDFTLPLRKREDAQLSAELQAEEGYVRLAGLPIPLADIEGTLRYDSQDGLAGDGIRGSVEGSEVGVRLIPLYDQSGKVLTSQLEIEGDIDVGALAAQVSPTLGNSFRGSTPYVASLKLPLANEEVRAITIESDLVGATLDLPAPLHKSPEASLPSSLVVSHATSGEASIAVTLGRVLSARMDGTLQDEQLDLDRGAVTFGGATPRLADEPGLTVSGKIGHLDLSGWAGMLARLRPSRLGEGEGGQTLGNASPVPSMRSLDLQVDRLQAAGQELTALTLALRDRDEQWALTLAGDDLAGEIFVPKQGEGPVVARFSKLHFPPPVEVPVSAMEAVIAVANADDRTEVKSPPAAPAVDPRGLPTVVLEIDDFAWQRLELGHLTLELQGVDEGVRLPRLAIDGEAYQLEGEGAWLVSEGEQQLSTLALRATSSDLLGTLERFGFAGTMNAKAAELSADFQWNGPPSVALDDRLAGELRVKIESGQLLNVRPGAGKIFGLMSVAALPRRLELDFRDVFDKGLGFDEISGTFTIAGGDAYTEDLKLLGQTADVRISGRTGLVNRDYDQTAVVSANVGSPLPVAGALAGGPVVGAALLIFSEIMKEPLKDLSRTNYRITGPWADPTIERVTVPAARREAAESDAAKAAPSTAPKGR